MKVRAEITKREDVEIDLDELFENLKGLIAGGDSFVKEDDKGKLGVYSDHGYHTYSSGLDRELTKEEEKYWEALQIVEKFVKKNKKNL
jgi:hypothetical protein